MHMPSFSSNVKSRLVPNCDFCTYYMGRVIRNSLAAFQSPIINLNAIINVTFSCQTLFYIFFLLRIKWNETILTSTYELYISWYFCWFWNFNIWWEKWAGLEITNQPRTEGTKHKVIILLTLKWITKIILQDHKSIEPKFMCLWVK